MKQLIAASLLLGAGAFVACNNPSEQPAESNYEVAESATVLNVTGMT